MNAPATLDFDRHSEFLRLALRSMSEHRVPMTPRNYWVWHEHVSGNNRSLSDSLEQAIDQGAELGDSLMEDLYSRYISSIDFEVLNDVQDLFVKTAVSIANALKKAVSDTDKYQVSLDSASKQLQPQMAPDAVKSLVDVLSLATKQMQDGNQALKGKLDESKREIQVLRHELQQVREECNKDNLTGLANRKAFREQLEKLSQSIDVLEQSCVLFADIDRFKSVNDEYGHLLGDKVIGAVAKVIDSVVDDKGLAARYGGEEFAVLLPDTDLDGARAVAEDIRSSVERGKVVNPRTGEAVAKVTISVGASKFSRDEPVDATLEKADQALYKAKDSGRNKVVVQE